MIRAFRPDDYKLKPNEFTKDYLDNYREFIASWDKRTFDVDGAKAIIGFLNYNENNYKGFFVISEDFKPTHLKELKKGVEGLFKELNLKRLETESLDCEELNRWHEFLGFKLEGTKRKCLNGNDYNVWGLLWD